jgi:predicted nucleotidyltransferase
MKSVFQEFKEIEAVYLFGSMAAGMVRAASNIDLAIYPGKESMRQNKIDILQKLPKKAFAMSPLFF